MKSNAVAKRILGMTHWRSNTQLMQFIPSVHHAKNTGKLVSAWVAIRTRSDSYFYFN